MEHRTVRGDNAVIFFGYSRVKIRTMSVHPGRPWVLTADERGRVVLWDYDRQTIMNSFSPEELQQLGSSEADANAPGASADGASADGASAEAHHHHGKIGSIKSLCFYDELVLFWSCGHAAGGDHHGHSLISSPHWVVLVTEHRIMLVDIGSPTLQQKHITADDLQHHTPTCAVPVTESLLLVGCSDGLLRFWDWRNQSLVKVWLFLFSPRASRTDRAVCALTQTPPPPRSSCVPTKAKWPI